MLLYIQSIGLCAEFGAAVPLRWIWQEQPNVYHHLASKQPLEKKGIYSRLWEMCVCVCSYILFFFFGVIWVDVKMMDCSICTWQQPPPPSISAKDNFEKYDVLIFYFRFYSEFLDLFRRAEERDRTICYCLIFSRLCFVIVTMKKDKYKVTITGDTVNEKC